MCGESFNFINEWKSHMIYCLSIENQIPYQDEDWNYDNEVKTEIKTKKKHFCTECGQKFQNKRKLKHHFQTIHELKQKVEIFHESKEHIENIVKDFNCDICSLSFTKESRFKEHADSVHGDKKPFKCSICPKSLSGRVGK